jgi:hypothetical protein
MTHLSTATNSRGGEPTTDASDSRNGPSSGAKAGIGAGVSAGVLLLIGAGVFAWRRRAKAARTVTKPKPMEQSDGDILNEPGMRRWIRGQLGTNGPQDLHEPRA